MASSDAGLLSALLPLAIDRQQNLKSNSPSRRLSLMRLAGPAEGFTPTPGSSQWQSTLGDWEVREPWSDPLLLSDPTILEVVENMSEIMVRLCAAENTMSSGTPGMRH